MAAVAAEERRVEVRRGAARKLLVLDINGLLLDTYFQSEKRPQRVHDTKLARFYVYKRPHCDRFVKFCLQNFLVAVWSSAKEHNVNNLVDYVFGESRKDLVFCWSQSHCTNSGMFCLENRFKPLFFKELSKVWECSRPEVPWNKGQYGPWNTLLIDDSPHKILRNPDHTAILPLAFSAASAQEDDFLLSLESYLERLLHTDNVQKFVKLNPFGQPGLSAQSPDWQFYLKAKLSVKDCVGKITEEAEVKLQPEKEVGGTELRSIRVDEQDTSKHTSPESRYVAGATDLEQLRRGRRERKRSTAETDMVHAGVSDEEQEMRKSRRSRNHEQRRSVPEHVNGIEEHAMSSSREQREARHSAQLKLVHGGGATDELSRRGPQRETQQVTESQQADQTGRRRSRPWISLPRFERQRVLWYRERDRDRSKDEAYDRRPRSYELEYDCGSRGAQKRTRDSEYDNSSLATRNRKQDRYESEYDYSSRGTRNRKQDRYESEYDYSSRGTRNRKQDRYESKHDYSSRDRTRRSECDYNSRGSSSRSKHM